MVDSAQPAGALTYDLRATMRMIEDARATGVLTVSGDGEDYRIIFDRGDVVAASSDQQFRLGQELVNSGQVTQERLDAVLGLQRRKKQRAPLGEILVALGIATAEGVRDVLRRQCVSVLRRCLGAGGGTFEFLEEGASADDPAARFNVSDLIEMAQGDRA